MTPPEYVRDDQTPPIRGEVIRHLRAEDGRARAVLAVHAGVSDSTWQRAEKGEPVAYRNLVKIAKALGVPVSTIYTDAVDMETVSTDDQSPPPWLAQLVEQLDARLSAIESTQAEILRITRKAAR